MISVSTPYFNRNVRLSRAFGQAYAFENIKDRIYYRNYQFKEDKVKTYDGIKINSELLKTSSFYRLYVHFLYILGKLPPKIHYEERTQEYYKEIEKFNKLCDELNMISDYNLTSIEDVQNLRTRYLEEISPLKAQKEEYMKLYNKTKKSADKTILEAKINILSQDIDRLNSKIQTCRRIITKTEKGEKEDFLIQKRFKDNKEKAEKEIVKNKVERS